MWTAKSIGSVAAPGAKAFAILYGLESLTRSLVAAALPIQTQQLLGNDEGVSVLFLVGSISALSIALLIPKLATWLGRTRLCTVGILMLLVAAGLFMFHMISAQVMGFIVRAIGSAIVSAVLNMIIMDHVRRDQIGRAEPLRLLFIGLAWTFGPILGVYFERLGGLWAPFAASAVVAFVVLLYFWALRFSDLPAVRSASHQELSASYGHLREFFAQPRLVLAWLHAIGRGTFWASFTIYTPIFAVQTGLGAEVGGLLVGIGSGFMLAMPLWGWLARRFGIRRISLVCFPVAAVCALTAGLLAQMPWAAAGFIMAAALPMSVIDGYGNALFFRACKPSQRTTMTPIFSAQRDISEISTAAVFAILLTFLPIQVVYITLSAVLAGLTLLSLKIHSRL